MDCPRCRGSLVTKEVSDSNIGFEIEYCTTCKGSWFDFGELDKIDKTKETTIFEFRKFLTKKEQLVEMYCPVCRPFVVMEKMTHPRDSKVIIDVCPSCKGVWLDKGELESIQKQNWLVSLKQAFKSNKE